MPTDLSQPIALPVARTHGARTFASLFALESFARASVSSVIPIQAYELLRDKQAVSILYTAVSFSGLAATLLMPVLLARFPRRFVYTAGVVALLIGAAFFTLHSMPGQVMGMLTRSLGAGALSITLTLYIMDNIRKSDFVRSESLRMAFSTFGWTLGPTLGVLLYNRYGIAAAQGLSAAFSVMLLALFWYYRLSDDPAIKPGKAKPARPLANVGRFIAQPRLRLAWLIAFGRSCFWTTFFVYGPILMVVTGEGTLAGGLLVSAGNAVLFTALVWGRIARRLGARLVIAGAFAAMVAALILSGFAGETYPRWAAAFLLVCALFAVALDAVGPVPFLRAVRAHERPQMSAVYRTYLDLSDLLPPLVYSVVLAFSGLGAVFATLAAFMLVCAAVAWRYVPRSL